MKSLLMVVVACGLIPVNASADIIMSQISAFAASSVDGSYVPGTAWDTIGGDNLVSNLYLIREPSDLATDPFINSGNTAPTPNVPSSAAISESLSIGSHRFAIIGFGADAAALPRAGMNLFFNNNNVNPGISAYTALSFTAPPAAGPGFSAIPATSRTYADPFLSPQPLASGTLSFTSGNETVTLTDFRWYDVNVFDLDRVGSFDANPDGPLGSGFPKDVVATFTLQVSSSAAVPEPSPVVLVALGGFCVGVGRMRRRMTAGGGLPG